MTEATDLTYVWTALCTDVGREHPHTSGCPRQVPVPFYRWYARIASSFTFVANHASTVCTLASRYYDEKPHIYSLATHLAKASAGNSFIGGWKTLEMCQAYFLLGGFSPPARRWEEDRSWFYTGLSFRFAPSSTPWLLVFCRHSICKLTTRQDGDGAQLEPYPRCEANGRTRST